MDGTPPSGPVGGPDDPARPQPSLVRPYARTRGRTRPARDVDIEALVVNRGDGIDTGSVPLVDPEHGQVIELCRQTVSVAEIAVALGHPIGVTRVIIADMMELGLVDVLDTSASRGDERDPAFLRRVLSGLQRL